ncbi:factor VII-activating protease-like [Centroberyx gerrardi]
MNLKLLFLCLFLAVLIIPAELKKRKHKHRKHGEHHNGPDRKHKRGSHKDLVEDIYFQIIDGLIGDDDDDDDNEHNADWIFELQEPEGQCNPNPCLNNGMCEEKGKRKFKCDCPRPFKGRKCEKGPKVCRKGRCGRGECVLTSVPPFYECKCKEPFQPPHCRTVSLCEPNPCKNGGNCTRDGMDFDCECPTGYRGRFCHVGPDDCYEGEGESYRGNVSETDDGDECLYWNSHFILEKGTDPFNSFEDDDGLGPHNFCRNPDGDTMPWCFIRRGPKLLWDYCDVTECPEPTGVAPTEAISPGPKPTAPQPQPTAAKPTIKPQPTTASQQPTVKPQPTTASQQPTAKPTTSEKPSEAPEASPTPPKQFSTCGKSQPKKSINRIYGGLKSIPGAQPWQVSLQVRLKGSNHAYRHTCGGVLIESCWVLTAGHCIDKKSDMQVVVGGLTLDLEEPTEQTLQVEQAIVHENYRETQSAVYNDIALLKLKGTDGTCANETQFVKTACLPDAPLNDGMECTISGWGATKESQYGSNHLLDAQVLLINQDKCSESKIYGKVLDDSMFCAGHLQGGVDSCQGDSGGPLTCQQSSTHVIYGLVSWGDQCGRENKPGVYTRVTHFLDWIKSKTQAASA